LTALLAFLRRRTLLLVLDNVEGEAMSLEEAPAYALAENEM